MGRVRTTWLAWGTAVLSAGLAVAYPAADLILLAIYADSVRRRRGGAPVSLKGRTYPAAGRADHAGPGTDADPHGP